MSEKPITYMLSKVVDRNSGTPVNLKRILKRYYTMCPAELRVGALLSFKDVDHPIGYHYEGEIVSIEQRVIRKRNYLVVSTKIRDYYLLEYQRRDSK